MVFHLPEKIEPLADQENLTPRQIVGELDKYIVGQNAAKKAVAIALRNRVRRQKLSPDMAEEVAPKNIIMIGPTGVGKTEIARRLARLTRSPFMKVEASRFTEVGYVGRDAESMVRDLADLSVKMVREEMIDSVQDLAVERTEERLLELLFPMSGKTSASRTDPDSTATFTATRNKLKRQLEAGELENRNVEIEIQERPFSSMQIFSNAGFEEMDINLKELLPGFMTGKTKKKTVKVHEAREYIHREEEQKLLDMEQVTKLALERVEQSGIIFIDEIDKIAGKEVAGHGPDVSREGVQRDILPIVEGTTVNTKYGMVRTDHILFIAAGAFHATKPSDLIPELQGRFPIRVELEPLTREDFVRILKEPKNALIKQYIALMETEDINLQFTGDAIELIAEYAAVANERMENIGARRLHTVMEKLLEDISFEGSELDEKSQVIDGPYVEKMLSEIIKDQDLSRYIL
jgi:ATP-dependent HslUV protease ATP-binding subunit HslU